MPSACIARCASKVAVATARDRLKGLIRLYSERMNTEGMAIEFAIRQWARSDQMAAQAVASVDAARLKNVAQLYRATGLEVEQADAQAFLFYCFIFARACCSSNAVRASARS